MERDEFEKTVRELFAADGKRALRRALRKHPLQFVQLLGFAPGRAGNAPDATPPLTEEETDGKVIGLLRDLGEERLTRLLAQARQN